MWFISKDHIISSFSKAVFQSFYWSIIECFVPFKSRICLEHFPEMISKEFSIETLTNITTI